MKKLKLYICMFIIYLINNGAFAKLPDNYQSYSAQKKQSLLWKNISDSNQKEGIPTSTSSSWGGVIKKLKVIFSLGKTFDHTSDEMPIGRDKIIHAQGSVAKFQFIPSLNNNPFTGMFKTGADGILRLSLAVSPTDKSYIPAVALKFLIDKRSSLNIVAMYSLEGQGSNWNFFANSFTTKIDNAKSFKLKIMEFIFERTHNPANDLPVNHLAMWNRNGSKVLKPLGPKMLTFKPVKKISSIISRNSRIDFRKSFLSIPVGPLYEVYGLYDDKEYHVGTIVLSSSLLASDYGDKKLFFQHQR